MATFWATFTTVRNTPRSGGSLNLIKGRDAEGLTVLTTSGTSQIVQRSASDWEAPSTGALVVRTDGAVWLHFAAAPVAAASTDHYLAANESKEYGVETGDKIAVKDA